MIRAITALFTARRQWLVLGFAVLGLTTSVTMLVFYLPVILNQITDSRLAIGFAVGVEGVVALTVPLLVGQASDRTWNRFGRRLPYMLAATPLVVGGLLAVAVASSYWLIVLSVIAFFIGYYIYYTAYQALYPDTLPANEYGRAWSYQNLFQGAGVALALLGGGALLTISLHAPFLASSVLFAGVALVTALLVEERRSRKNPRTDRFYHALPNFAKRLRTDRNLRLFLPAHFCWEYTLAAIRAFVILYLLNGLGVSPGTLFLILSAVIVAYLIAAIASGNIIDRFDPRRYTGWVVFLFAVSLLVAGLTTDSQILSFMMPFGAFAGAATLMLSYPILLRVTPADRRGEYTGYYQFNRGLALLAGTSLTGYLIDQFGGFFPDSDGYQVLWLACAAVAFLSLPFLLTLTAGRRASAT
jgi:MFS family permease